MTTRADLGPILITGDHGFVGRYVVDAICRRAAWCAGLDRAGSKPPTGIDTHLEVDLADSAATRAAIAGLVAERGAPARVIHLAAQASVGASFEDPSATYRANVVGTASLLRALAEICPDTRVLIPSSAHVYGPSGRTDGVLEETTPLHPTTHYGLSKLVQEEMARIFGETSGPRCLVTRAFNHIGPGQGLGFVVPDFAHRLARLEVEGGGVLRVGNLEARRDYLDVRDVAQAYLTVLEQGGADTVFNVASGATWSVSELLGFMLEDISVPVTVRHDPALARPIDVPVLAGDASRLRALGWTPQYDIRDTVRDTLDYWRRRTAEEQATAAGPTTEDTL